MTPTIMPFPIPGSKSAHKLLMPVAAKIGRMKPLRVCDVTASR